ncbi:MAG: hypothetical protein KA135_10105, partial [Halioglobus sp.]|nr:hypothetical protein [Halioglobus sp.]
GYRSSRMPAKSGESSYPSDSYQIHTRQCSDCRKIHGRCLALQTYLQWAVASLLLLAVYVDCTILKNAALLSVVLAIAALFGLARFRKLFE